MIDLSESGESPSSARWDNDRDGGEKGLFRDLSVGGEIGHYRQIRHLG